MKAQRPPTLIHLAIPIQRLPSLAFTGSGQPVRLSFQPLIFSQQAVFFSHNKSTNSTFSRLFSAQANRLGIDG
jgi:hypothetical protein